MLTHVEAILNTRPLLYIESSDTTQGKILTPADFLNTPHHGMSAELDFEPATYQTITKDQLTVQYRSHQKVINQFWQHLKENYRTKCTQNSTHKIPSVGDLVQIQHNSKPRIQWVTGKIVQLHHSRDNQSRFVSLQTPKGKL